jgi:acyl-coenzyme A synthetase/AMP-(fatty) acid ligase
MHKRKKLANALTKKLGIKAGDIVGTLLGIMRLMWLYYGIAGIGAVSSYKHSIIRSTNRISSQFEDRVIFVDAT